MSVDLIKLEEKILQFWKKENIFEKSLQQGDPDNPFIFYDGPPFATGTPHHGHLTASTIKDVIGRYQSMQGKQVPRRWGWDCHGLPIENEIHKKLGLSAHEAVEQLGIQAYNDECRGIVQKYTSEWQETIERLGRWVDFDNCYRTMDPGFMESVWWAFKQLWDKKLVYQGTKVMPFSTALGTPLSNFEASSNYQDVQSPAITVLFKKCDATSTLPTYFAAWTTTPWTLPSNLALAVNPNITYVKIKHPKKEMCVILAKDCLDTYGFAKAEVLASYQGSELVNEIYDDFSDVESNKGLWPSFACYSKGGPSHRLLAADFVRTDTGTGIVHLAPAFGEDDYQTCKSAHMDPVCPIDAAGKFTSEFKPYEGLLFSEANSLIIQDLKKAGVILQHQTINHSYPHCPRTDTPLIYKLVPCWYISVEKIKEKLLRANSATSWVPEHIKEGRFGSWLENAKDWCVSRNRVWGTPLPIWINDKSGKAICIGSCEELERFTADVWPIPDDYDLHRENVDKLSFRVPGESGTYHRIPEVFDCWFESGSMPFAQLHYPFENVEIFEKGFPANFIAEGQDQTRGWFYTLTVLSAALFDKPAFYNVIVNGIVLAEDGKKMAKRLKNYTDPNILLDKCGADALRLYLLNSGLTRAEDLKFTDADISDKVKSLLLPWHNAVNFFVSYAKIDGWNRQYNDFEYGCPLDIWIVEECEDLIKFVTVELDNYRLYNIIPRVVQFLDSLTNTYIRLNRRRFWGEGLPQDKQKGYTAFFQVLCKLSRLMAPLTPFTSEHTYQQLQFFDGESILRLSHCDKSLAEESVHLTSYPAYEKRAADSMLRSVRLMQQIIILGRKKREQESVEVKTPIKSMKIIHKNSEFLAAIQGLEPYIKAELNVKSISYHQNEEDFVGITAKPNYRNLGKRFGKRMPQIKKKIEGLSSFALNLLEQQGYLVVDEETFSSADIMVIREPKPGTQALSNQHITVELNCQLTASLVREGYARKIVSQIQNLRKQQGFDLSQKIKILYWADEELDLAITAHSPYIMNEVLAVQLSESRAAKKAQLINIDEFEVYLKLESK